MGKNKKKSKIGKKMTKLASHAAVTHREGIE